LEASVNTAALIACALLVAVAVRFAADNSRGSQNFPTRPLNTPTDPFRINRNIYYVGTMGSRST